MLKWIDNFEGYTNPAQAFATLAPASDFFKNYLLYGNITSRTARKPEINLLTSQPENRKALYFSGTSTSTTGGEVIIYSPLDVPDSRKVWMGMRIVNMPNDTFDVREVGQFGLLQKASSGKPSCTLKIGIVNRNLMSVAWVDSGVVHTQDIFLPVSMFGNSDYLEIMMEFKTSGFGSLVLWMNNRIVFEQNCVPALNSDPLYWSVLGCLTSYPDGANAYEGKYVSSGFSAARFGFGITDYYVLDDKPGLNTDRLGRIRVTHRTPLGDIGPNDWLKYSGATETSNAEIVSQIPVNTNKYISANASSLVDMYAGAAFPSLGSEQIIGTLVRVMAVKEDPLGPDIQVLIKSGSSVATSATIPLGPSAQYVSFVQEKDPATDARWLALAVNESKFGIQST